MSTENYVIEDHTPAPAENEYDGLVAALIEAGDGKRAVLPPVDIEHEDRARRRFSAAANRAGKSPKFVSRTESADGKSVALRYALTKQREYNRKDADAAEGEGTGPTE